MNEVYELFLNKPLVLAAEHTQGQASGRQYFGAHGRAICRAGGAAYLARHVGSCWVATRAQ